MFERQRSAKSALPVGRRLVEAEGEHLRGSDGFGEAAVGEAGGGDAGFDVSDALSGGDAGGE